jgi:LmbE family N-acetylglucosaminyl deacetylase/glycosyltransferase involved in cell wall biosynthesis
MDVSIVVITHDKLPSLRGVLAGLEWLDFPRHRFEVVVVDDGSKNETALFLDEFRPPYAFQVVHRPQGGVAAARNSGCAVARGTLLVMLDGDCLVHPETISRLWETHQLLPDRLLLSAIPHVAVARVPEVLAALERGEREVFDRLPDFAPDDREYLLEELIRRMLGSGIDRFAVPWVAAQGCSVSFSRALFERIGGYDGEFRTYGMEDFEFALRLTRAGVDFARAPGARHFHLDHGHAGGALFRESTQSVRHFYKKYGREDELTLFVKFLCGALSFRDFNNQVAARRGMAGIADLDVLFSPFGMVSYRDKQLAEGGGATPEAAAEQDWKSQPEPSYDAGQRFRLDFVVKKLGRALDDGRDLTALARLDLAAALGRADLENARLLVVAPHMDDEVIGCGGLVQRCHRAGARVSAVYLTDGASGDHSPEELGLTCLERREESAAAARLLGISTRTYLNFPERRLREAVATSGDLVTVIREEQPDVIAFPAAGEFHPDHRTAHDWVLAAVAASGTPARLLGWEIWGNCRPTHVLELTDAEWRAKLAAIKLYRTQTRLLDYPRVTTFLAATRGRAAGAASGFAECFHLLSATEVASTAREVSS